MIARKLLQRIADWRKNPASTVESLTSLIREIEDYLAKPQTKPYPVATVNVWIDEGLPYFNTYWNSSPTSWRVGTYYLYAEPLSDWQPIETAPKDGSEIIMFAMGDIGICYWSDKVNGWTWGLGKYFNSPTHWMPLPKQPTV